MRAESSVGSSCGHSVGTQRGHGVKGTRFTRCTRSTLRVTMRVRSGAIEATPIEPGRVITRHASFINARPKRATCFSGSRMLMAMLKNKVERGPLPAGAHRSRPTMGLGRAIRCAQGLQRLRALRTGRPRALVYPGEGRG